MDELLRHKPQPTREIGRKTIPRDGVIRDEAMISYPLNALAGPWIGDSYYMTVHT